MGHKLDIDRHVRTSIRVFVGLLALTVMTVLVSYIDLSTGPAIALALAIATFKASLVLCFFMHLISEKKWILWIMGLTAALFFFVLLLPTITEGNSIALG